MKTQKEIERLLPAWFDGTLSSEEQDELRLWKEASEENARVFAEFEAVWEQTERLRSMKKYKEQAALANVHRKINKQQKPRFLQLFKTVAAVLVFPLLFSSVYFFLHDTKSEPVLSGQQWYTLKTGSGMRSEFQLPDGTNVWLNSNTTLRYPMAFSATAREVFISGEAYFDVAENQQKPFLVNTGKLTIQVTGTEFMASNYPDEHLTEIVLVEGSVNLCQTEATGKHNLIHRMQPGDRAILEEGDNKLFVEQVNVAKYIAWKDGKLIFRDDAMTEVVRRLNRWYGVDIQLNEDHLEDYVYTATFEDESLFQVLDLLKLSAPIEYTIKQREQRTDNTFSKMEIEISRKD